MKDRTILVTFHDCSTLRRTFSIVKLLRPEWKHYNGCEFILDGVDVKIIFTLIKPFMDGAFKGYKIIQVLSYRPGSMFCPGTPDELVEEIENLMLRGRRGWK